MVMANVHCLVHPLPGTEDQLNDRLKELGVRLNWNGSQGVPAVADFHGNIREVAIGPSHFGILTEDGRIARLVFSINTDSLDLNKAEQTKGTSTKSTSQGGAKLTARMSAGGRRIVRTASCSGVRGVRGSGVIMGAPPLLPAQYVPEELITQAQVVLQGKSRNLIIRELQRSNLDVNLAVNNLLSRDDEDVEEAEESNDSYAPEDLISLLDANISVATDHPSVIIDADGMFSEDMFGYSSVRSRSSTSRTRANDRDRDSASTGTGSDALPERGELRWRDRHYSGPNSANKKESSLPEVVDVADNIQWWPDKSFCGGCPPPKFAHIAALHSELIAVSVHGQLYQWRWADREPYTHPEGGNIFHPKVLPLGLVNETITAISAASVRCSVATDSGRVATWMDETLADVASRLEQPAQLYPEFQHDRIMSLFTCPLYTCAWCESGALFWWGVLPFNQRKRLWEKFRSKKRKQRSEISDGVQVGMRSSPMYHPGALAFCMSGAVPKIGQLLSAAWSLNDTCRFKILPPGGVNQTSATSAALFAATSSSSTAASASATANSPVSVSTSTGVGASSSSIPPQDKKGTGEPPTSKLKTSDSKDSNDKLDMPPPPSPASSTCSDTGSITSPATYKRGKRPAPKDDSERFDEEDWPLKEVIFVEDTRPVPIGEVLAVDGDQVVVAPQTKEGKNHLRVIHRDQLQVIRTVGNPRVPECYQRSPKKIPVVEPSQILTVAVDGRGIHAIARAGSKINYIIYNLSSGKLVQECALPTDSTAFLGSDASLISLTITGESENVAILRDGNGTIYPLSKDCVDSIKDPRWPDLPPITCLSIATQFLHSAGPHQKNHVALLVLATKRQILMPKILRCDLEGVRQVLALLESGTVNIDEILQEKCDGNHNILHACVSACCPVTSKEPDSELPFEKESLFGSFTWPPEVSDGLLGNSVAAAGVEEGLLTPSSSKNIAGPSMPTLAATDPNERRSCLLLILKGICESGAFKYQLKSLLMAKDSNGLTPFMLAVSGRAYQAALILLDVITKIARDNALDADSERRAMAQMVFPRGSNPDNSPLHVLCYNDTCSFTWTGHQHINQDIFECRTCGLTGSLCCCSECASVCHKGHDCKLKHTSPKAYCDCWQKCKCKALKAGHQNARFELLSRLVTDTDLVNSPNGKGENILLFLLQTVRRQVKEQKQYRCRSSLNSRKSTVSDSDQEMPDHDLEPPKFSRKALERLLKDWNAVKAMVMKGYKEDSAYPCSSTSAGESVSFMQYQGHTTHLDKFTYCLLVKLLLPSQEERNLKNKHISNSEDEERKMIADNMVTTLINTLLRELHNDTLLGRREEAIKVARRFVASAVRIFVVLAIEMAPTQNKKKTTTNSLQPLAKCIKVFESLLPMAVCELCEAADALMLPVRLNYVKPTAPFPLTNIQMEGSLGCQEMFEVEPLQRHPPRTPATASGSGSQAPAGSSSSAPEQEEENEENSSSNISRSGLASSSGSRASRRGRDSIIPAQPEEQDNEGVNEREEPGERPEVEREEGGEAEGGESDMELDLAESDSDSEDNQSGVDNASAQRSVQTGATAGSEGDEDSGDSSAGEDEDDQSEAAETDEFDAGDVLDEQLERRINAAVSSRSLAPHHLQWAIRNTREGTQGSRSTIGTGGPGPSASNIATSGIYIDPTSIRRSPACSSPITPSAHEPVSLATTNNTLARAFTIVIRQMSSLINLACEAVRDGAAARMSTISSQNLTSSLVIALLQHLDARLHPTWDWLLSLMDSTEAQLRFGRELNQIVEGAGGTTATTSAGTSSLSSTFSIVNNANNFSAVGATSSIVHVPNTSAQLSSSIRSRERSSTSAATTGLTAGSGTAAGGSSGGGRANLPLIRDPLLTRCQTNRRGSRATANTTESQVARRETLSYVVSLLRAHKNEHCDTLPDIDVGSLKHIAYVFDSLMCYLRSCDASPSSLEGGGAVAQSAGVDYSSFSWERDENDNEDDLYELPSILSSAVESDSMDEDSNLSSSRGRKHPFFQRSNSTLCLGSVGIDVFNSSMSEALPLADKPHLLQPNARREDLFGHPRTHTHNTVGVLGVPFEKPLSRLGVLENQQISGHRAPPTKDAFYEQLFSSTDYFQQQPTDLSATSSFVSSLARDYKNDSYSYERERVPIIVSPRRSQHSQSPNVAGFSVDPSTSYNAECTTSRLGVKSVIVRVGSSTPNPIHPPPPYSLATSSCSSAVAASIYSKPELASKGLGSLPAAPDLLVVPLDTRKSIPGDIHGLHTAHDVSANVTIDSTQEQMKPSLLRNGVSQDLLLGRWRLSLELFGWVFIDDVGAEPGSVIAQLGGFPFKEAKLRREMEKLRNSQQRDLNLTKIERERGQLISQTFKELNTQYTSYHRRPNQSNPPLAVNRVKVTFKDEPGEGSGVARSFYTAIAEALLSHEKLPSLEACQVGLSVVRYSLYGQYKGRDRDRRQAGSSSSRSLQRREAKKTLSVDARPFYLTGEGSSNEHLPISMLQLGEAIFTKVQSLKPPLASKITGMLLELAQPELLILSASEDALRQKVDEAVDLILSQGRDQTPEYSPSQQDSEDPPEDVEESVAPLFYQPGKRGFYCPRQGKPTPERMNAFRNVGRLIGLCLLQNELCPIYLNRHVLKYILNRSIRFHDLAFFDPIMYESLRKLVLDAENKESGIVILQALDLNFSVDLIIEEAGGNVELIPGGRSVEVNSSNVYDYVRKYAEYRMVKCQEKALQNIRDGVFDVIPASAVESLTAEDLRLLLNGVGDINVSTLISYTSFNDESAESSERLHRFKRWLWSIVEKMSTEEKQDLVYFWTGSPALPASEEGFQPMPSVTIRPADDSHLPTANTCISRLYIPLYSTRAILRSKLLLAIKTKNFGFV